MKIAFTTDYYWPHAGGGVEAVVQRVATELAGRGHDVRVVTLRPRGAPRTESIDGVSVLRVPKAELGRPFHLSMSAPLHLGFLGSLRDADVVNIHNPFFGTSMAAGLLSRRPLVTTLHVGSFGHAGAPVAWAARAFERSAGRRILSRSRFVTAVSEDAARNGQRWGADPNRLAVIPNGIDAGAFAPNGDVRPKRIVYVGRLTRNKGAQVLAQALPRIMEAHPDAEVDIVGTGPMASTLRRKAAAAGWDSLRFHGQVADVAPFLRHAALYVRPSLTDGMPLCVLEAMACATPVVASDVGGTREVLDHGREGSLVRPGDHRDLADACIAILDRPDHGRIMGRAGHLRAGNALSWRQVAERYLDVFEQVVR